MAEKDDIQRFGMVIGLKDECISEYRILHDGPGVRDLLRKYGIHNFNIFLQKMPDGKFYEFAYYEYHGSNHEEDLAALAKEPENIEWLKKTDAMQVPLQDQTFWSVMEPIFFNH